MDIKMGKVGWQSPSNIALIKYWGKHGIQLPSNPSISVTLKNSVTKTYVSYEPRTCIEGDYEINLFFEGKENKAFVPKIEKFFDRIVGDYPMLKQLKLTIESENTFPHSAGIASSASSMSALSLCILSIAEHLKQDISLLFFQEASRLARLGSGSACRSLFSGMSIWGETVVTKSASQEYGIGYSDYTAGFKDIQDAILIVSGQEKSVSSTVGHGLMDGNRYAAPRFEQARDRLREIDTHLRAGRWAEFGQLVEDEALTLHALMMTSNPSFLLLKPNSLEIIEQIRAFRAKSGLDCYFTIDAGPNIHLLYPKSQKEEINQFIDTVLKPLCENELVIFDEMGLGPKKLM